MKIIKVKDYEELSARAAEIVAELVQRKEDACLGLATGGTPLGMYRKLIEKHRLGEISFKNVSTFNLDEYCELEKHIPNPIIIT